MEYRKEQNFIVAYEGTKMSGKWNILTNEFIGIKGMVLKSVSPAFTLRKIENIPSRPFRDALLITHYNATYHGFTPAHGKRLEEIISVGLRIRDDSSTWEFIATDTTKLTKEAISFIQEENNGVYTPNIIKKYNANKKYSDFLAKFTDESDKAWVMEVIQSVKPDIPSEFVKTILARAIHEKVRYGHSCYSMITIVNEWYTMQTAMKEKPTPAHNILTQYQILKWRYNEYLNAHYDEVLRENNDKPWLYFETEQFIVRPLLSKEDFHAEAEHQRNCVERMYMPYVKEGRTHVVVVRKKSNPNDSFITCEVSNYGHISQYLYAYNRHVPYNTDEGHFKELYAEHLRNTEKG